MALETNSSDYQRGLELAEAGKHAEALAFIQTHLRTAPEDSEALNDAGAILHCLGRSDQAVEYLTKARALKPNSSEILWNLGESYLVAGRTTEAMELFDDMQQAGILNPDILNRAATQFLNQNDKANAVEVLLCSDRIWPNQKILAPILDVVRSKRPKIAFFCGGDGMTFLDDIVEFTKLRFRVRVFEGRTEDELLELMQWSDISWFEWCTNLAAIASKLPKVCKNIVRLHRYEAYENWPYEVNWNNIDTLITVGNNITKRMLLSKVPDLESCTSVVAIANGVDPDKFKLIDRKQGKNIAFLANIRMVKNPAFVLQCMQKLHYIDPEYRLFFAGEFKELALEQYLRHMVCALELDDVVFFDGWQEDVNSWLQDKHFIVSTSTCEGHPVGLLEGMACGLKPIIHNFPSAEDIFPSEFLFNISEEFCEHILSDTYQPQMYRKFVEDRYSLKNQLSKINDIFTQFETRIDSELSSELTVPTFESNVVA